jgi:hypothetical protein
MKNAFRSAVLAALLLAALPAAQAATQSWNVSGMLDSGHYTGQSFAGTFSFDDAFLSGSGEEWLTVDSLALNFAGMAYTLADADVPAEVSFFDGAFLGLSYSASNLNPQISFIPGFSSLNEAYIAYDISHGLSGAGDAIYAPVPEPETYAMLLAGLGLLGVAARRRRLAA